MSNLVRRHYLLTALLSFLGGCLVVLLLVPWLGSAFYGAVKGTGHADVQRTSGPFTISGSSTRPISPGVRVPLNLTFTNPHDYAISVSRLRVTIGLVSAPSRTNTHPCGIADFTVIQSAAGPEPRIEAGASSTLQSLHVPRAAWPNVGMLNRPVNQDGCQGAKLTLNYTASGKRLNS